MRCLDRLLKGFEVDDEAETDGAFLGPVEGFIDFGDRDDFHIGQDIFFRAVIEHLLSLFYPTDERACQRFAAHD